MTNKKGIELTVHRHNIGNTRNLDYSKVDFVLLKEYRRDLAKHLNERLSPGNTRAGAYVESAEKNKLDDGRISYSLTVRPFDSLKLHDRAKAVDEYIVHMLQHEINNISMRL